VLRAGPAVLEGPLKQARLSKLLDEVAARDLTRAASANKKEFARLESLLAPHASDWRESHT